MVAGIIASGIGALGSIGGALASNALSSSQMQDMAKYQAGLNYKYWKKQQVYQPSLTRQGLIKADYNPMLALSNVGAGAGTSAWSSLANPTTPDLSGIGNNAVSNALAVKQQSNQDKMTESQVKLNNSNSVLSQNRALTETYTQLEKMAHTDLMEADKVLRDKQATYQEKQNAWYDKKVTAELERIQTQNKVDLINAFSGQVQANSSMVNANANAKDVESKSKQRDILNSGYELDNLYKGGWLSPYFNPGYYNYGLNGMHKQPYK